MVNSRMINFMEAKRYTYVVCKEHHKPKRGVAIVRYLEKY